MQTIEGFINNENKNIDTTVDDYFIKEAYKRLKVSLEYFMTEPRTHLETYSMCLKFYFKFDFMSFLKLLSLLSRKIQFYCRRNCLQKDRRVFVTRENTRRIHSSK